MKSSLMWLGTLLSVASAAPMNDAFAPSPYMARAVDASVNASSQYPSSLDEVRSASTTTCATSNGQDASALSQPLYTEAHRPQFHFSPSTNFMNDPNGLVYSNGLWHLFYQYNPTQAVAGNQHWGHAVSKDLYTWQNLPIAIAPEKTGDGIFSGSAVLDVNNTSGLFDANTPPESRFAAIYTLNTPEEQTQHLAYSNDGINFTKYNQTLISINSTQFRDPKVFWDEEHSQWVMTTAHAQEYAVVFYASPNLRDWHELSRFSAAGLLGYQYECPDLAQIPIEDGPDAGKKRWVLINSINPGSPLGGSIVQYWVGNWNGRNFTADDAAFRYADFGKDFYAFQSWSNAPDGKAYGIGWANNWQYTQVVPTSPFRSIQSTPRELTLKYYRPNPLYGDLVLNSKPAKLENVLGKTLYSVEQESRKNHTVKLEGDGGFEVTATFAIARNANLTYETVGSFEFVSGSGKQSIKAGIQMGEPTVMFIDRSRAGKKWARTNPFFTDKSSGIVRYASNYTDEQHVLGPLSASQVVPSASEAATGDNEISLQVLVDRTVLEAFANEGELSGTSVFYFDNDEVPTKVKVSVGDDKVRIKKLSVKQVRSTWPKCA
ncbi:Invertase [Thecaphora frezii]